MPRRPRLIIAGQPHHVVQRGHNRKPVFFARQDYLFYLDCLRVSSERFGCHIHAYCLMTNHIHLLVTPPSALALSRMMQMLGRLYVRWINRELRRSGTLWEDRYKISLVDAEDYLLGCMRYIELNPVRARMVAQAGDYPWSSFGANGYGNGDDPLVTRHAAYLTLGADASARARAYRDFVAQAWRPGELQQIRAALDGNWVLGSDNFRERMEKVIGLAVQPRARGGDRRSRGAEETGRKGGQDGLILPAMAALSARSAP